MYIIVLARILKVGDQNGVILYSKGDHNTMYLQFRTIRIHYLIKKLNNTLSYVLAFTLK